MAPAGRGKILGCGVPPSGSAGSCGPAFVARLLAVLGALVCALANAAHKKPTPAKTTARLNSFRTPVQNGFMVVGFPRKVALMGSGILARPALTAKEIADSWYPSFAPLFLRRKCAAPQTFGV